MKPNKDYVRFLAISFAVAATGTSTVNADPIEVPNWNFEVDRSDQSGDLAEGADIYMAPLEQDWYQYNVNTNGGPQRYWNPGDPNDPSAVGVARFVDCGFGGNAPEGNHVGIAITRYNDNKFPDGSNGNVGDYVRDFEAIAQVLEDVKFDPSESYTLTVDVGHPPGAGDQSDGGGTKSYAYNGYKVQLLAGGYEHDVGSAYAPTVYDGTVIAEDNNTVNIAVNTFQTIVVTYNPGDLSAQQEADLADLPIQIRLCALEDPVDHSTTSIVAFDKVLLDGPAQTIPTPAASITPPGLGQTDFTLQWTSFDNHMYSIYESTTLGDWTLLASDIAATPPSNTYAVPPNGTKRFYRIIQTQAP